MDAEVFEGRTAADFEAVVERLRAEGRPLEADQVSYLYASWLASHGRLTSSPSAAAGSSASTAEPHASQPRADP